MRLTEGLISYLQESMDKTVVLTLKEDIKRTIIGRLIGFDDSVLLLNPFEGSDKLTGRPTFIDLESVCMLSSAGSESFERYKKAFERFREEYMKKQRLMNVIDMTETI